MVLLFFKTFMRTLKRSGINLVNTVNLSECRHNMFRKVPLEAFIFNDSYGPNTLQVTALKNWIRIFSSVKSCSLNLHKKSVASAVVTAHYLNEFICHRGSIWLLTQRVFNLLNERRYSINNFIVWCLKYALSSISVRKAIICFRTQSSWNVK